jgi:RIO kinase 1
MNRTVNLLVVDLRNHFYRLKIAGIPSPEPLALRKHVLLMTFVGKGGWAAPKLKDVALSEEALRQLYRQILKLMWKLYHQCKLVHADLSEYNIL